MAQTSLGYNIDQYAIAQSFYIYQEEGIFLTAVDVYFKTVSDPNTVPVLLELRPMENGQPSSTILIPGSEIAVPASRIQYSTDASLSTRFEFEEPIFLPGLKDYCFVLATNSSNYELFGATGDTFVLGSTEKRITKQQTLGSLFFSQNAATFTAAQEMDLSFKLIRAKFKHTSANARLNTVSLPQVILSNNPLSIDSGSNLVTVYHPNHGFQPNDRISMSVGGGSVGNFDSDKLTGIHKIYDSDGSVDPLHYQIELADSATSTAIGGGSLVTVDKNIPYSIVYPNVQHIEPLGTSVFAGYKGLRVPLLNNADWGSTSATSRYSQPVSSYTAISLNENNQADQPYAMISDKLLDSSSHTYSGQMEIRLETTDSSISPIIDLQRASLTVIGNQIDRQAQVKTVDNKFRAPVNFVEESAARGGSASAKHITNTVTLEQDAVGLKVFLAANRPPETDFQVWFRTATGDENIEDKSFTLLSEETNNPADEDDLVFRDYEYLAGGLGGTLDPFTKFQMKIEMRSYNQARTPIFSSLRVIAMST
tara:strand:+ start:5912 stop:7522 length:1611 start_codon:yes stop_codon:yes gene_type:complete